MLYVCVCVCVCVHACVRACVCVPCMCVCVCCVSHVQYWCALLRWGCNASLFLELCSIVCHGISITCVSHPCQGIARIFKRDSKILVARLHKRWKHGCAIFTTRDYFPKPRITLERIVWLSVKQNWGVSNRAKWCPRFQDLRISLRF